MEYRPVPHEDMTTEEEVMLSAPYSDVESWERMIEAQLLRGISRFRGLRACGKWWPPGWLRPQNLTDAAQRNVFTSNPAFTPGLSLLTY